MSMYIHHVTKVEFLSSFIKAHYASMTSENIQAGFQGSGLVPLDPARVLDKLDVRLRTPSPILGQNTPWYPKTPRPTDELASQKQFIKTRIARHHSSSSASINEALNQLTKGAEMMISSAVILEKQVALLQRANTTAMQRRGRIKRRIQTGGTITIETEAEIGQAANNGQDTEGLSQNGPEIVVARQSKRRCGYCRQSGHRVETCTVRIAESN